MTDRGTARDGARGARRRRAIVLLSLALVCGGLAASQVSGRVRDVERRTGQLVPVVVARGELAPGTELTPERVRRVVAVREVPERYVPRDSLASPDEAIGLKVAVPLVAGSYLTAGALKAASDGGRKRQGGGVGKGERAVEVAVAGGTVLPVAGGAQPGRVDVLVTAEGGDGEGGRTYVALQDVEMLGMRQGTAAESSGGESGGGSGARTLATLRVTLRQAIYLTAAQNFARELRLLARPPGDRREAEVGAVASGAL